MDVGMFDVRWLKSFNSHFGQRFDGEYSRIAKMLMIAQNQCFEDDGKGWSNKGEERCERVICYVEINVKV